MFDLHDFVDDCRELVRSPRAANQILGLLQSAVQDADAIKKAIAPADPKAPITDANIIAAGDATEVVVSAQRERRRSDG